MMEGRAMDMKRTEIVEMKKIIDHLESLLEELGHLGREMPVIEKNVKAMKSFVAVLHYGISDLAEIKVS
jgi:hypothetical protein